MALQCVLGVGELVGASGLLRVRVRGLELCLVTGSIQRATNGHHLLHSDVQQTHRSRVAVRRRFRRLQNTQRTTHTRINT